MTEREADKADPIACDGACEDACNEGSSARSERTCELQKFVSEVSRQQLVFVDFRT